jgi:APA family basic amino acid/polyamine antiporter
VITPKPAALDRRLGPLDAAVLVISNVIGVGIFTTPGFVATLLPTAGAMLGVWAIGGLLAFVGSLAYAELAARRPQAGGEYVYLRESFGRLAAFLTGWTSFVAGFSGAIAAGAVGVTAYLDRFLPGVGDGTAIAAWHLGPLALTLSPRVLVALAIIGGLALIHARGLGPGRIVQVSLTVVKVVVLGLFVIVGLIVGRAPLDAPAAAVASQAAGWSAWLLALVPVMFSYAGWNAAVYIVEEVRDPTRNVPRALALGTATVVALYLAMNALYLRVVPREAFSGGIAVGEVAAGLVFGSAAATLFAATAVIIILGSLSAMTLAGPRVYFAMARDGAFFPAAGRVHARHHTPAVAILAQAGWSALLVVSGTFEQLLTYTGFSVILFSALAVLSLFVVRRRHEAATTFRMWGYPWAPALFCLVSLAIVVNAIVQAPGPAFTGLGVMAAGIPLYWWTRWRTRDEAASGTQTP